MDDQPGNDAWVFHAGALGDFVMVWPLIRALGHSHERVHVVADSEKSRLAAEWIALRGKVMAHDGQHRAFTRLWAGEADDVARASLVVNMVADPQTPAGMAWEGAAARMFAGARLAAIGTPGSESRRTAWSEFDVHDRGRAPARSNPNGAIVCHVGAGSPAKRWPMTNWRELCDQLNSDGDDVRLIAGEVEAERFTPAERRVFESLGGAICTSLEELARTIARARVVVGADTGPTHLAAQLGVPTLALFGPTDPGVWAPVGPGVRVQSPVVPGGMGWLGTDRVAEAVRAMRLG